MKKILTNTGFILLFIGIVSLGVLWYAGVFTNYSINEMEVGPYSGLYDNVYGNHADASDVRNEIYQELKRDKIKITSVFGIYYKEPETTPKGDLMGYAGCIVAHDDSIYLSEFRYPYKHMQMAVKKRIVVDIRYENNLTQLAGMLRIHPAMRKYARLKGYPVEPIMEIYDLPNQRIRYIMPIGNADKEKVFQ